MLRKSGRGRFAVFPAIELAVFVAGETAAFGVDDPDMRTAHGSVVFKLSVEPGEEVLTDKHSPGRYRALAVRNLNRWYEAFDIKPGDKHYLEPGDRVLLR